MAHPTMAQPARMDFVPVAQDETDATLDEILGHWHRWQRTADRGVRGFKHTAVLLDAGRRALQYDGQMEQIDADLDNARCRQVDHEVREMGEPHRTAIYCDARNLANGLAVWNSPRLPRNPDERDIIVRYARRILVKRLQSAGVM